ncbi:MAG: hypothetical protein Q8R18_01450 [bacterium]|nr:hypothetical protein [bacterium]
MELGEIIFATLCTENRVNNPLVERLESLGYSISFADPEPHQGILDPTLILPAGESYTSKVAIAQYLVDRKSFAKDERNLCYKN